MAQITLNSTGVASDGSLVLQSNGTTAAVTVDTSQNVGVGVTPSAWSTGRTLQLGHVGNAFLFGSSSAGSNTSYGVNAFFNSGWKYGDTGYATRYSQDSGAGSHVWFTAPSGTAGNAITFTEAMRIDSSGNVGIGTSSPATGVHLQKASGNTYYRAQNNLTSTDFGTDSAGIGILWNNGNYPLAFGTNNTERARITSGGDLLVGKTAVDSNPGLQIYKDGTYSGAGRINYTRASNANTDYAAIMYTGGTGVGSISYTNTATAFNTSSDYRLKHDIQPMTGALAKVAQLKPVTYKWNADDSQSQGFIAHELQEVVPECVTGEKDAVDADGNPQYQGIDTSFLVATLTAAIQELKALVDTQNSTITTLTDRITALEQA
jgi:hypothetical protein